MCDRLCFGCIGLRAFFCMMLGWYLFASNVLAEVRIVAQVGEPAPGTSEVFGGLSAPTMIDTGEVAFGGELDDDDFSAGIWSEGDGVGLLRNVALMGDIAPDSGGALFDGFEANFGGPLLFNNLGDIAIRAFLDDGRIGLYTDRERPTSALTKIALEGEPAVGASSGGNFTSSFNMQTFGGIHSGVAFTANVTGQFSSIPALYSEGFNVVLGKVAEQGEDAPDTVRAPPAGGIAQFDEFGPPTINDTGHIAFRAGTNASTGAPAMGDEGVWTTSPNGTLRSVALQGQSAPGTQTVFSNQFRRLTTPAFDTRPSLNNDGDVAFLATLLQFEGNINVGIWAERDGTLEAVAVEMDPAPTTGSTFQTLLTDPLMNQDGDIAFLADLADGREGIWLDKAGGALAPIAFTGDSAPGTSTTFSNIQDIALNDSGQIAFLSELDGFTSGIFATNTGGTLTKVVAEGDLLDTTAGMIQVNQIDFIGHSFQLEASGANGFSNAGKVALLVDGEIQNTFEEFTGIIVMDIPSSSDLGGDFNGDGKVDTRDYVVWRNNLGAADESALMENGDGMNGVDIEDYHLWVTNFGMMASATLAFSPVPEPNSLFLLLLGITTVVVRQAGARRATNFLGRCPRLR